MGTKSLFSYHDGRFITIQYEKPILGEHKSRASNIAFLLDSAQMLDLDFGLIWQNISIKKALFQYQGYPLSLKSGKLWLNCYVYWISITSNWFYSQQFSLLYSKNILLVWFFRGDKKKKKKSFSQSDRIFPLKNVFVLGTSINDVRWFSEIFDLPTYPFQP